MSGVTGVSAHHAGKSDPKQMQRMMQGILNPSPKTGDLDSLARGQTGIDTADPAPRGNSSTSQMGFAQMLGNMLQGAQNKAMGTAQKAVSSLPSVGGMGGGVNIMA